VNGILIIDHPVLGWTGTPHWIGVISPGLVQVDLPLLEIEVETGAQEGQ
jgi:hypothetical protein